MSIIWDFKAEHVRKKEEKPLPRPKPRGATFVWCAQAGLEVFGAQCPCYMANNYYFTGKCPVGADGRTFRDPHD